jgi:hypothetical protein
MICLTVLLLATATHATSTPMIDLLDKDSCSRQISRTARKLAHFHIIQPAIKAAIAMSTECPFQPSLDQYLEHETHGKVQTYRDYWQCTYSGKTFKTEKYLDLHLQRFWNNKMTATATECLANWCDVLGCHLGTDKKKMTAYSTTKRHGKGMSTNTEEGDRIEHKCRAVLHACFPPSRDGLSHRFKDEVFDALCLASSRAERDSKHSQHAMEPSTTSIRTYFWYALVALVTFASVVFYTCYFLQRVGSRVDSDLKKKL